MEKEPKQQWENNERTTLDGVFREVASHWVVKSLPISGGTHPEDSKELLASFKKAVKADETDSLILASLAEFLVEAGSNDDLEEAERDVNKALSDPNLNYARYVRALIYWNKKEKDLTKAADELVDAFEKRHDVVPWQTGARKDRAVRIWMDASNQNRQNQGISEPFFKDSDKVWHWAEKAYALTTSMELRANLALVLGEKILPNGTQADDPTDSWGQKPNVAGLERQTAYALLLMNAHSRTENEDRAEAIDRYWDVLQLMKSDPDFKKLAAEDVSKGILQPAADVANSYRYLSYFINKFVKSGSKPGFAGRRT
jgi:hypothetical protein